ncbi:translation initiation factor IF-3 [Caloranaerobacter azorensis]|uniref:Translation initiation factor IF-3 n=2 Tax=Caloranaerobacter azorensis TaxID=116090 RepID=A0A096BGM9_9FIRM|nr:translation initiation factor IF-3 [Caloranaerobacter azorensis]KGG80355.1 translation initiation factor IF-3 [Caloranaerobacter azorensis H53214]QIB28195.1 translation initiation factor IF-3 [Caloranaerobacter azorensis]
MLKGKNTRRCPNIKELQINEQIRDKEVRLIDVDGSQLGVMPVKKAQQIARERKLDLVKVAPNANPPVCRIMDYGKYKYEQAKKAKEAKKNQKVINVKEIRLTPNIEEHDLNVKAKKAVKFLKNGDRVKVTVRFRGRELGYTDKGEEVLMKFAELTKEVGNIDKKPKLEGRNMIMILSPIN